MSKGMRLASWILAIITITLCDVLFVIFFIFSALQESSDVALGALGDTLNETVLPPLGILIPLLQVACMVFAIIAAVSKAPETLRTTRAIMLTFKLGLIPFFVLGGIMEGLFILVGFHPVLLGFGWLIAIMLGILGWLTVLTGSTWSIATAIQLRRLRVISAGEMVAHIVLSLFFVADVVDAIVLFIRSKDATTCSAPLDPPSPSISDPMTR